MTLLVWIIRGHLQTLAIVEPKHVSDCRVLLIAHTSDLGGVVQADLMTSVVLIAVGFEQG